MPSIISRCQKVENSARVRGRDEKGVSECVLRRKTSARFSIKLSALIGAECRECESLLAAAAKNASRIRTRAGAAGEMN